MREPLQNRLGAFTWSFYILYFLIYAFLYMYFFQNKILI